MTPPVIAGALPFLAWIGLNFYELHVIEAAFPHDGTKPRLPDWAIARGWTAHDLFEFPINLAWGCLVLSILCFIVGAKVGRGSWFIAALINLLFAMFTWPWWVFVTF